MEWPVPQALHGPAYLSEETSSAAMAAVAVESAAIVPLRWWASGRNTACEEYRGNFGSQRLICGQKMADWRPRAVGPSYISGPFIPPIHFRILPLEFKGPELSLISPKDTPTVASGFTGYLSCLALFPPKKQLPTFLASRVRRTGILVLQLLTRRQPATSTKGEAGAALHVWSE